MNIIGPNHDFRTTVQLVFILSCSSENIDGAASLACTPWLIINFVSRWAADLTKDLTKFIHSPACGCSHVHLAASAKSRLTRHLSSICGVCSLSITLYIGGRMSSPSCHDDGGLPPVHPLISLGEIHLATGFAQTFAQMPANSGQTSFQFNAYE